MPIFTPFPLRPINQEEFVAIDYEVTRHAFASQNTLGRLCDEEIYQGDLAMRLSKAGISPVRTEVPVTVSLRDFSKTYFLDLVVADAAVYELKTASQLMPEHEAQLLNYLYLEGVHHGKLINFRPAKVQTRFGNTGLTYKARRRCLLNTERWQEPTDTSRRLRTVLVELLQDWGAFLEIPLYLEALTHLVGGTRSVVQKVPLYRDGTFLGKQCFHMLSPGIAFRITAITEDVNTYEEQLTALLRLSHLKMIQWINLNHHQVSLTTLRQ